MFQGRRDKSVCPRLETKIKLWVEKPNDVEIRR